MAYLKAIYNIKFLIMYFSVNLRLFLTREENQTNPSEVDKFLIRCFIDLNKGFLYVPYRTFEENTP